MKHTIETDKVNWSSSQRRNNITVQRIIKGNMTLQLAYMSM